MLTAIRFLASIARSNKPRRGFIAPHAGPTASIGRPGDLIRVSGIREMPTVAREALGNARHMAGENAVGAGAVAGRFV